MAKFKIVNFSEILGKKVVAFRGCKRNPLSSPQSMLEYILFDDGETFMRLSVQDKCDYHDASASAREIVVGKGAEAWQDLMHYRGGICDVANLGAWPF
jgi:hypothetical protein